eukprot:15359362-Ditylum_brightwellii.AAC.1
MPEMAKSPWPISPPADSPALSYPVIPPSALGGHDLATVTPLQELLQIVPPPPDLGGLDLAAVAPLQHYLQVVPLPPAIGDPDLVAAFHQQLGALQVPDVPPPPSFQPLVFLLPLCAGDNPAPDSDHPLKWGVGNIKVGGDVGNINVGGDGENINIVEGGWNNKIGGGRKGVLNPK